jgi:hypothetical protein
MTTLSKKMIGYALGRTVRGSDRPLVEAMAVAGGNTSFSDLAVTVVTSRQFRNRVGEGVALASRASPKPASRAAGVAPAAMVPANSRAEGSSVVDPVASAFRRK